MTSRDFCYWLQGYFEIHGHADITKAQSELIARHLTMVFKHEIDPSFPKEQQETLNLIHDSGGFPGQLRC